MVNTQARDRCMELNLSTYLLVPLPPSLENWCYIIYHFFSVSGPFDNFLCIIPRVDPEIEEGACSPR